MSLVKVAKKYRTHMEFFKSSDDMERLAELESDMSNMQSIIKRKDPKVEKPRRT